jgi:hypothetical protein
VGGGGTARSGAAEGRWSVPVRDVPRSGAARRGVPPGRRVSRRTGGRAPGAGFALVVVWFPDDAWSLVIAWFLVITLCMADPRFARPVSTGR